MLRISFILTAFTFILAGCAPQTATPHKGAFDPYKDDPKAEQAQIDPTKAAYGPPQKVAVLLPLSGQHQAVGDSLLKAAQLALFDMDDPSIELLPLDTQGTVSGTNIAMAKALRHDVKIILGPLLGENVDQAGTIARRYNLNVIGFTTDSSRIGRNIFTVGILPYDQGRRLAQFAAQNRLKRVAVILPPNQYASDVTKAFEESAAAQGLTIAAKIPYTSANNASRIAQTLAAQKGEFEAVLMPFGTPLISTMAQALTSNGLGTNTIAWLGAGVWDDPSVTSNTTMRGAYYAAPSTETRRNFERQYQAVYRQAPRRLASLGYDATALTIVLLKQTSGRIDKQALLNANGFSGIDGVFRFNSNGMTERGMAIHRIEGNGRAVIVDPAPTSFTR